MEAGGGGEGGVVSGGKCDHYEVESQQECE